MKITILTYGSRGDVQPFVALALGLRKNGHEVRLAAPHRFTEFVGSYNIPFVPLAGDPEEISRRFNDAGGNPIRLVRGIRDYAYSIAVDVTRGAFAACDDADLVVHTFLFTTGAHSFARARGIPDVSIQTFPIFAPTSSYPPVALPWLPTGWLSYFGHWLNTQVFWYGGNTGYARRRKQYPDVFSIDLHWPFDENPLRPRTPLLFAVSPTILQPAPEWTNRAEVVGCFFLDHPLDYQPPTEIMRFLEAGSAPVCVTFGSMIHRASNHIAESVLDAIRLAGQRAVILTGWDGWKGRASTSDVLFINAVPHDWLLPQCKVVIHHGGAGTTAAGLRAGIPNIVIPFAGDQPFWGKRVHVIGAGPKTIPVRRLNAERLVQAMVEADGDAIRKQTQIIGRQIRSEDGVRKAAQLIERYSNEFHRVRL